MYTYRCKIIRVVDGDTVHAEVDLGLDVRHNLSIRLSGINAPELSDPSGAGQLSRDHLLKLITACMDSQGWVVLETIKDRREKYGRYLGTIRGWGDGVTVNQQMMDDGYAAPY